MSVRNFIYTSLLVCCSFEIDRKIRLYSEMLVYGSRGNLLGLGCLNIIRVLIFALHG